MSHHPIFRLPIATDTMHTRGGSLELFMELPAVPRVQLPTAADAMQTRNYSIESYLDSPMIPLVRLPTAVHATQQRDDTTGLHVELPTISTVPLPAASHAMQTIDRSIESYVHLTTLPTIRLPTPMNVITSLEDGQRSSTASCLDNKVQAPMSQRVGTYADDEPMQHADTHQEDDQVFQLQKRIDVLEGTARHNREAHISKLAASQKEIKAVKAQLHALQLEKDVSQAYIASLEKSIHADKNKDKDKLAKLTADLASVRILLEQSKLKHQVVVYKHTKDEQITMALNKASQEVLETLRNDAVHLGSRVAFKNLDHPYIQDQMQELFKNELKQYSDNAALAKERKEYKTKISELKNELAKKDEKGTEVNLHASKVCEFYEALAKESEEDKVIIAKLNKELIRKDFEITRANLQARKLWDHQIVFDRTLDESKATITNLKKELTKNDFEINETKLQSRKFCDHQIALAIESESNRAKITELTNELIKKDVAITEAKCQTKNISVRIEKVEQLLSRKTMELEEANATTSRSREQLEVLSEDHRQTKTKVRDLEELIVQTNEHRKIAEVEAEKKFEEKSKEHEAMFLEALDAQIDESLNTAAKLEWTQNKLKETRSKHQEALSAWERCSKTNIEEIEQLKRSNKERARCLAAKEEGNQKLTVRLKDQSSTAKLPSSNVLQNLTAKPKSTLAGARVCQLNVMRSDFCQQMVTILSNKDTKESMAASQRGVSKLRLSATESTDEYLTTKLASCVARLRQVKAEMREIPEDEMETPLQEDACENVLNAQGESNISYLGNCDCC
jgi:hypothetical protein